MPYARDLAEICQPCVLRRGACAASHRLVEGVRWHQFTRGPCATSTGKRTGRSSGCRRWAVKEVPLAGDREFIAISSGGIRLGSMALPSRWRSCSCWSIRAGTNGRAITTPGAGDPSSRRRSSAGAARERRRYNHCLRLSRAADTWLNPQGQGETPGYASGTPREPRDPRP